MLLPCYYNATTMLLPCYYNATTMLLPCYYNATTMLLQCYYHATTMLLPCYYNANTILIRINTMTRGTLQPLERSTTRTSFSCRLQTCTSLWALLPLWVPLPRYHVKITPHRTLPYYTILHHAIPHHININTIININTKDLAICY